MRTVTVRDTRTGRITQVPETYPAVFPHLVPVTGQDEAPPPNPPEPLGDSTATATTTMPLLGRGGHTP